MTARISPTNATPGFAFQRRAASGPSARRASTTESSIVALHVHDHATDPNSSECRRPELALERLAVYLETEGPALSRVLHLLDLAGGRADLAALDALHVDAGNEAEAVADAARRLEGILGDLENIPVRAWSVVMVPAGQHALGRELDAAVRWLGARTADTLAVMRQALR